MTQQTSNRAKYLLALVCLCLGGSLLLAAGCRDRSTRSHVTSSARQRSNKDSQFLVTTLASGLNHLADEVVLELTPPKPILDDSKSADGQPVLAACDVTPAVPDGPFNYLHVPAGNGNFQKVGVKSGDVVRYFVLVDQESVEHGFQRTNYLELIVRRLDHNNRQNALIIEGGVTASHPPARIEIWRYDDKRMNEIRQRIERYVRKPNTQIGWEPSPDESALAQLLERANQWFRNLNRAEDSWQLEPAVDALPANLREAKPVAEALSKSALQAGPFAETEARQLQQAIWLRDISRWAKGDAFAAVDVARQLFDWTIRNIQLDSSEGEAYVHQPWQALMYGHGTAEMRAWVFADLCRQQQLDVVMLAAGDQWWLPAVLNEGKLYLFDTRLGLPIPGKQPGSVATLTEVVNDPTLLSDLDVDDELKYATRAEDLPTVTAQLVASPLQLARRAALLQESLKGDDFVVLSANTSRISEQLAKIAAVSDTQLWPYPFESMLAEGSMAPPQRLQSAQRFLIFAQRPRLWKARVLQFQGTKEIPIEQRNDPLAQPDLGHKQAIALYQHPRIRPSNAELEKVEASKRQIYTIAKGDASYWLGLLSYDLGKYKVAKDWLARRTLAANPDGPWTSGANYNLARTHEALGDLPAAIELLEADQSPQRHGNLLRARRLKSAE
ncbi:MAG: tetratricopeptide repeat protein [Bythopirellula sp.]